MQPVEAYIRDLRDIHSSGAGVPETSYYTPFANLLNEIGKTLKPKVRCIINLQNRGAGLPDGGLFAENQFQRMSAAEPLPGQPPERGAIEIKSTRDDAFLTAKGKQVSKYWDKYRLVLVTNYRDFVLIGQDREGGPAKLESYSFAENEAAFWKATLDPRGMAAIHEQRLTEYLKRVMLHAALLSAPKDVAWFLASYARDAKARIESTGMPAVSTIRTAFEEALGLRFQGKKGEHFFRSSLVQTLFYGIFSAWVLWSKQNLPTDRKARFDWRTAAHYLRVPILRKLFHEVADPGQLEDLELSEVLDWAGSALSRVDRASFFTSFDEGQAVQYFYEPFLEAFDPELRKDLGVWYTPTEVVQYMVARVDTVLREELDIPDGLADPRVYVLDPCCGTGAYLVEVLKRIAKTIEEKGEDGLGSYDVKRAAMERVFGFEILPAPFVVSHLQLGVLLQNLGTPLSDRRRERVAVYLTNALTGWEPPKGPKTKLLFPELEEERDAAEHVKRDTPILVVLGNPPYNGFAGVAIDEERDLSKAYRTTKRAPAPQGQGLNDLYARFFRMAERRIVEKTGQGVVCFISNYSWLERLSFTGMRERYLEVFDQVWVDCLNGDKFKTGKLTPEGRPDPSIFSTELNPEGIQLGTAITLLVRQKSPRSTDTIHFRHLWGRTKRTQLLETASQNAESLYQKLTPPLELGLPFMPATVKSNYLEWPLLPDLFPISFPGVKTSRDDLVVNIDRENLVHLMKQYCNQTLSHEEMQRLAPKAMESFKHFNASAVRDALRKRGFQAQNIVRYCYRPFDVRWIYWESEARLLDRSRPEYFPHVFDGNLWIEARQQQPMEHFDRGYVLTVLGDNFGNGLSSFFPLFLAPVVKRNETIDMYAPKESSEPKANLSSEATAYISQLEATASELFYHTISILHAPAYRNENANALRQNWPRVPLPNSNEHLRRSTELGHQMAMLLNTESSVSGVTSGTIRSSLRRIAVITRKHRNLHFLPLPC